MADFSPCRRMSATSFLTAAEAGIAKDESKLIRIMSLFMTNSCFDPGGPIAPIMQRTHFETSLFLTLVHFAVRKREGKRARRVVHDVGSVMS